MNKQTTAVLVKLANRVRASRRARRRLIEMYRKAAGGWPIEPRPVPVVLADARETEAWNAFQAAKKMALDLEESV